jgi:hypothetical protein
MDKCRISHISIKYNYYHHLKIKNFCNIKLECIKIYFKESRYFYLKSPLSDLATFAKIFF